MTAACVLYTDGAARNNPGPASAGWVIELPERTVEGYAYLGRRTNNEAEYEGVLHGLRAALELGVKDLALRSDSQLLVRQLTGEYRVKNSRLLALHASAKVLIGKLQRFSATHIPRAENHRADALANRALDERASRV